MKSFPSKILLFGEYAVLFGAPALAIPYRGYSGQLVRGTPSPEFERFIRHILEAHAEGTFYFFLDADRLKDELTGGLNFKSDIPRGYGLGSSAALCAAVLHRYGLHSREDSIAQIHKELQTLEHYFHGKSSGLDPLVSYYGRPVFRSGTGVVEILNPFEWNGPFSLWLLNMNRSRETEPLVRWFLEQREHPGFKHELEQKYVPAVSSICLKLKKGLAPEREELEEVSRFQWHHFRPLIPNDLRRDWERGLAKGSWIMKLCGAGGGGMMLVFTSIDFDPGQLDWELIPVFPARHGTE